MTDPTDIPQAIPPERERIEAPSTGTNLDALPVLYLLGFIILAASLIYVWRHPNDGGGSDARETQRVDTLRRESDARRQELAALAAKVAVLEARPAVPATDLRPLDERLRALDAKVATLEARPAPVAPDLGPLTGRLAAVEDRKPVDLGPLDARIAAVENRKPVDLGPLEGRVAAVENRKPVDLSPLERRSAELGTRLDATERDLGGRITGLDGRITGLDGRLGAVDAQGKANAASLAGVADRAQRARRVASAAMALESGQRLGDIPGAPASVARFAQEAPPTDASLRLSFDAAADAAHRASQPAIADDKPLLDRMWTRAQQSVTVRQGDRVLVGDPIAGVLANARQALDAGDLAGAVKVLNGGLAGPAKAAMTGWIGRAQSLLDARAGLSEMAAG